jgi:tellurite resistance protein TehA-like permease
MFNSSRISKLVFAAVADLYVASVASHFVERFWPAARILTFVVIALSLIAIDLAAVVVEAHRGKHSTLTIWLIHLGFFFTGMAVVLVIGGLVERRFAEGWGTIVDSWGLMVWGTSVLASLRNSFHARQLEEDIESSPASVGEDKEKIRRYYHPYI